MAYEGSIIVPTTKDKSAEVLELLRASLATKFGGYSEYDGSGGWESDEELIEEDHVRLEVLFDPEDHENWDRDRFEEFLRIEANYVKETLGEEAVLVRIRRTDMILV